MACIRTTIIGSIPRIDLKRDPDSLAHTKSLSGFPTRLQYTSAMLNTAPPPATRDLLPEDTSLRRHLETSFVRTAESYGFEEIATPMFERADLFAARSGPEIKSSMFAFHCDHEEYVLRPEMTAPVCRLVASGALADRAIPYKLFYVAPCFRYCHPHSGRFREFTQAGLELIGEAGPSADAEVIAAASRFLRSVGVKDFSLKIGTVGIFRDLLPDELSADDRATVIGHLDRLISIDERCASLASSGNQAVFDQLKIDRSDLATMQAQTDFRGEFAIEDHPTPTPEELAERLPREVDATLRRVWNVEGYLSDEIADLLIRVSRIRGTVDEVSARASEILQGASAGGSLENLLSVCRLLKPYGVGDPEVVLGIARGLTFYTGTVFEISSNGRKYCGGGRYDNMIELFGGGQLPSTGCAFRFDTLSAVAESDAVDSVPRVALQPSTDADLERTVSLSEGLRDRGLRVGGTGVPVATVEGDQVRLADGRTVEAAVDAVAAIITHT